MFFYTSPFKSINANFGDVCFKGLDIKFKKNAYEKEYKKEDSSQFIRQNYRKLLQLKNNVTKCS